MEAKFREEIDDDDVTRRLALVLHHVNVASLLGELYEFIAFEVAVKPRGHDATEGFAVAPDWG